MEARALSRAMSKGDGHMATSHPPTCTRAHAGQRMDTRKHQRARADAHVRL